MIRIGERLFWKEIPIQEDITKWTPMVITMVITTGEIITDRGTTTGITEYTTKEFTTTGTLIATESIRKGKTKSIVKGKTILKRIPMRGTEAEAGKKREEKFLVIKI